jgi:hypothetical protein
LLLASPQRRKHFGGGTGVATISWKHNTDGNWSNAANWSGGVLPGAGDTVVLDTLSYHTISFSSITATIGAISAITDTLALSGGSLSVRGAASFGQNLSLSGATLNLASGASVAGTFIGSSGLVTLGGGTTLTLNAILFNSTYIGPEIDGAGVLSTSGTTTLTSNSYTALILGGGIAWDNTATVLDAGQIITGDSNGLSATLVNAAGASFDLTTDGAGIINGRVQNSFNQTVYGSSSFSNAGTVAKTGGTNTSTIDSAFTNTGVVTAASGTLEFDGGGSFGGTLSGAGQIAFGGGTATILAGTGLTVANLLFDGAAGSFAAPVSYAGTVTLSNGTLTLDAGASSFAALSQVGNGNNHLDLNGASLTVGNAYFGTGFLEGAGTLTTTGTTTLAGSNSFYLGNNLAWVNSGTVNQTYYVDVDYVSGAGFSITNAAGATYDITGDFQLGAQNYNGTSSSFTNAGTFAKTGGSGTSQIYSNFSSTGTVSAVSGTNLEFDGNGSFAGTLAGAGTLSFASGSDTFAAGLSYTAAEVLFDGANVTLSANTSFAASEYAEVNGNVALGGHTLTLASAFLGGGAITGPGTIATSGTTTVSGNNGGGVLYLGGGVSLVNSGIINQTYYLYVNYQTGAGFSVTNKLGATYNLTGNFNIGGNNYNGIGSTFANAGTFAKVGGTGTTQVISTFTNTGTVTAANGTLEFDGGGTLGGKLTGTGAIAIGSNTMTLSAGLAVTAAAFVLDGGNIALGANLSLTGTTPLTIDSAPSTIFLNGFNLSLLNADIGCGYIFGAGTLTTTGTTTIGGYDGYGFTETGMSWINSGTLNQGGTVYNYNSAGITLTNSAGASYDIQGDFGYGYNNSALGTFTNAGTFAKAQGTNTSSIYTIVKNTGVISSASGNLEFDGGGSFGGTLSGAGAISFGSNTATLAAGVTINVATLNLYNATLVLAGNVTDTNTFTETSNDYLYLGGNTLTLTGATLSNGTIDGAGTLALNGTTQLAGTSQNTGNAFYFGGQAVVSNTGTVMQDGTVYISNYAGSSFTIDNAAGAVWDLINTYWIQADNYQSNSGTFNNAGTFTLTGGTNYTLIYAAFNNTGTVSVTTGEIAFESGGNFSGSINGAGLLSFQNNGYNLGKLTADAATFVEFYNATINLTGAVSINGTLGTDRTSSIELGGQNFTLASLALQNAGAAYYFDQAGTFTTSGSGTIVDWYNNGVMLSFGGGATWSNTGTMATGGVLQLGDADVVNGTSAGTLINAAGAALDFTTDDAAIHQGDYYNASGYGISSGAVIINAGTLAKTGGTNTSYIYGTLTSTGTLAATTGTLALENGGGISGAIADGSSIVFGGGIFADGALTIGGGANVSNSTTINANGIMTLGDSSTSAANFTNSGLFDLGTGGGIAVGGSTGGTFTNTGTLIGSPATGRDVIAVSVVNSGTIIAQSGTLALTGSVTGTGALDIAAGATLELGAGVVSTQSIAFATSTGASTTGTLLLDSPASATETISGFTVADAIDFAGLTATKALVNASDQLVVYNGNTIVGKVQLAGSYLSDTFTVASDKNGGSLVTLTKVATAWTGTNGDWFSVNVWSNGLPTAQTNATVSMTGAYNLTLNGNETAYVATLALSATQATYNFYGTLNVSQSITMTAGSMALNGTINGGIFSVSTAATVTFNNAGLNNVAYQGILDLSENYAYVSLLGTTSFAGAAGHGVGTINLTGYDSTLYADGYFTLDNATLDIGNNGNYAALRSNDTNGQGAILTLGSALAIVQTGTYATISDSGSAFDAVYNEGKITAGFASGIFSVTGDDFQNDGNIAVSNGDDFSIQSAQFVNTGTLTVSKGTLGISSAQFLDVGSISATSSTLNLGTTLSGTELTKISAGGTDTLNLSGTLNEAGGTLSVGTGAKIIAMTVSGTIENATVKPTAGSVTFLNGAVLDNDIYVGTISVGGSVTVTLEGLLESATIADSGGGIAFGAGVELEKDIYQGTLSLLSGNTISILGGITLQGAGGTGVGAISAAAGTIASVLDFLDTETLSNVVITSGTGSGPGSLGLFLGEAAAGSTLTLANTVTFNVSASTTAGLFSISPTTGLPLGGFVTNNGFINVGAGATFLGSDGSLGGFTNAGKITLASGATWSPPAGALTASAFTNAATGNISLGTNSVLLTNGGGMTNAGSITLAAGAAATIQGNFAETGHVSVAAGASFTIDGTTTLASVAGISGAGTLGLDGLLSLGGGTFDMAASGRITNVQIGNGGYIKGGIFINDAGTVSFAGVSTLDTMTWEGPLNIGAGATVQIANVLTLENSTGGTPGVANLSGGGALDYLATTLLDNTTINSSSPSGTADLLEIGGTATSLTLGANFILNANGGDTDILDAGTEGGLLVNNGALNVTAGALWLDPSFGTIVNNGAITLADNTELDPTPGAAGSTSFTNTGTGVITLTSLDNFDLAGNAVNAGMMTLGAGSEVTVGGNFANSGSITMSHGCSLTVDGSFVNSGTILANGAASDFVAATPGAASCFNNGTLTGGTWSISTASTLTLEFGGSLTADAADIVLRGAGTVLRSLGTIITRVESTLATITSAGTLAILGSRGYSTTLAMTDSGTLQIQGGIFNAGGLTVASGGLLTGYGTVSNAISNLGTIDALGGTLMLGAAVTGAGVLAIGATGELEIGKANAETVAFATVSGGELRLDTASTFTGTLSGFASGDSILLASTNATLAVLSGSTLTVTLSGGTKETFHVAGNSSTTTLVTTADGSGDTLLTFSGAAHHNHAMPVQALTMADLAPGLSSDVALPAAAEAASAHLHPAEPGGAAFWAGHANALGQTHGLMTLLGRE